ncbi:hypothetical protein ACJX0J_034972, partial [Zea mays]
MVYGQKIVAVPITNGMTSKLTIACIDRSWQADHSTPYFYPFFDASLNYEGSVVMTAGNGNDIEGTATGSLLIVFIETMY